MRGRVNLAINGSFWVGAALGAALSMVLLDPRVLGPQLGWRAAFVLGAVLAVAILLVRRHVPESPRWLMAHGRVDEAERDRRGRSRAQVRAARSWHAARAVREPSSATHAALVARRSRTARHAAIRAARCSASR